MKNEKNSKQKTVTRTYRNGQNVYAQSFVIRLKPTAAGDKFVVTERRDSFLDEKIISGTPKSFNEAERIYDAAQSTTVVGNGANPFAR